ncbi:MAG: FAD-binding and (Fe-S)-binding domain-containing protein [Actinomycetales bacterium]
MASIRAGEEQREVLPPPLLTAPRPEETTAGLDVAALERDLRTAVDGEVRFDAGSRAAYSTDASNFRQVPIAVVVPRTVEAAVAAVEVCARHRAPLLSRGGGTSLAGQCTNTAVVIDWTKYCTAVTDIDPAARTCVVEPGIVLDELNKQLAPHGLEFGPCPATHNHCTLGGMIGNNSCGSTAQRTGKTVDNVEALEVLLYDGTRMWVGATDDAEYQRIQRQGGRPAEIYRQLRLLRDEHLAEIRTRFPHIPRRVSGYNLDSLLPENGFHVGRALVGTEGACVTVLRAKLRLVPVVAAQLPVLFGAEDIAAAADLVPTVLPHEPIAVEGMDERMIRYQREKGLNPDALRHLPQGNAYLMVQLGGSDEDDVRARVEALLADLGKTRDDPDVLVVDDRDEQEQMWLVRESALGATARAPGEPQSWPGWEDSAVPPDLLGTYLRQLRELLEEFGYGDAAIYGHFGQGCVHGRIPFDLTTANGVAAYRRFLERAAGIVLALGGSFSGEHGDGQQRAELLPRLYGDDLVRAMGQFTAIFDPDDRMNPGKMVPPYPLDDYLRLGTGYDHSDGHRRRGLAFAYPDDGGDFGTAVLRCVGVGKCRRHEGGVMCPSYMVTREEEHSTRGRARLLFEMLDGTRRGGAIADGWRSDAVRDALDLCFACKGCKADCPVNVDMATYKAEFLYHHYKHRLRPRAHYSMGWLPVAALLAGRAPRLTNAVLHAPVLSRLLLRAGGIDQQREAPRFAEQRFTDWWRGRQAGSPGGQRGEVLLWPDSFTNAFDPDIAVAAVEVLEDAGYRVVVPEQPVCCGLTWISTGQLDVAKAVLRRTLRVLEPHLRAGTPIVGLEPSCTAVFRSDAAELLPGDADVQRLQQQTVTLAELLRRTPGWRPPHVPRTARIQTHCHQHAVLGVDDELAVLREAGVEPDVLDSGCCGLAGNFGFEAGHYEVSMASAERVLLPAVRAAAPDDAVLADGFSCRTQIAQGDSGGRRAVHLAQLLRAGLRGDDGSGVPEHRWRDEVGRSGPKPVRHRSGRNHRSDR